MVGIELGGFDSRDRTGTAVCMAVRKHGVIIRPLGGVIVLMPPLAMPLDDLQHIVDALAIEVARL